MEVGQDGTRPCRRGVHKIEESEGAHCPRDPGHLVKSRNAAKMTGRICHGNIAVTQESFLEEQAILELSRHRESSKFLFVLVSSTH